MGHVPYCYVEMPQNTLLMLAPNQAAHRDWLPQLLAVDFLRGSTSLQGSLQPMDPMGVLSFYAKSLQLPNDKKNMGMRMKRWTNFEFLAEEECKASLQSRKRRGPGATTLPHASPAFRNLQRFLRKHQLLGGEPTWWKQSSSSSSS